MHRNNPPNSSPAPTTTLYEWLIIHFEAKKRLLQYDPKFYRTKTLLSYNQKKKTEEGKTQTQRFLQRKENQTIHSELMRQ